MVAICTNPSISILVMSKHNSVCTIKENRIEFYVYTHFKDTLL